MGRMFNVEERPHYNVRLPSYTASILSKRTFVHCSLFERSTILSVQIKELEGRFHTFGQQNKSAPVQLLRRSFQLVGQGFGGGCIMGRPPGSVGTPLAA